MGRGEGFKGLEVVSDTVQRYGGTRFYKCGTYFQNSKLAGEKRLHRIVWSEVFGPIPEGHHIHHRDGNPANNEPSNLQCLPAARHLSEHGDTSAANGRKSIEKARAAAAVWHGSDEGRKWHSEHYAKHISPLHKKTLSKECVVCGKEYAVSKIRYSQSKYCHANCKARALRKRRASRKG